MEEKMKSTQKMSLYFWWTVLILGFLLLPQIFTLAAPMAINATNYHWENKTIPSGWFGGNANANQMDYTEGQVVPHWLGATGLATGTTYGFYIYYNYFRSGTVPDCGFDYLATWNTSLTPDKTPPGNTAGAPTPSVDGSFNGVGGSGSLYTSSNVTNVTIAGPFPDNTIPTANTSMYVRITFQINSGTSADFYYGLHLALDNSCYSPADGASGWSGASLQTRVLASSGGADATPPTATYFGSGASLQINPGAFKPAVVAGYKWYDLNGDGVWQLGPDNDPNTFDTGEEPTITGWTIQLWSAYRWGFPLHRPERILYLPVGQRDRTVL